MIMCKDCGEGEPTDTGRCKRCEDTWQAMYEWINRPENRPKKIERVKGDGTPPRCKVCGKEFVVGGILPMVTITPACNCKSIRSRVREKGCPACEKKKIGLTLNFGEYTAKCHECGNKWWVMEDII